MGNGIDPQPPVFATGMPGYWVQYNNTGPFPPGVKCRPARVIDLGFVAAWQQASDEFPHLDKAPPTNVANAAFQPSSTGPKSLSTRVLEAAPNPVQIAYQKWGSR